MQDSNIKTYIRKISQNPTTHLKDIVSPGDLQKAKEIAFLIDKNLLSKEVSPPLRMLTQGLLIEYDHEYFIDTDGSETPVTGDKELDISNCQIKRVHSWVIDAQEGSTECDLLDPPLPIESYNIKDYIFDSTLTLGNINIFEATTGAINSAKLAHQLDQSTELTNHKLTQEQMDRHFIALVYFMALTDPDHSPKTRAKAGGKKRTQKSQRLKDFVKKELEGSAPESGWKSMLSAVNAIAESAYAFSEKNNLNFKKDALGTEKGTLYKWITKDEDLKNAYSKNTKSDQT